MDRDGVLAYTNKGVSMLPLLREDRDVMVIRKKGAEGCGVLDAVLFKRPSMTGRGRYVLHRILRDNHDGTYWIVGDNCTSGKTVKEENILGVLTAVVRKGKTISTDNRGYRFYVSTWCRWYHLCFFLLRIGHAAHRVIGKLRRMCIR